MEKVELIQVEEDDPNIFKKFTRHHEILKKLDFELINDVHTVIGLLTNKTETDDMEEIVSENKDQKKKLFVRL